MSTTAPLTGHKFVFCSLPLSLGIGSIWGQLGLETLPGPGERVETPEQGGLEMGIEIWVKVCDISETEFKQA